MRKQATLGAGLICLATLAAVQARTWTDSTGRVQVEAEMLEYNGEKIWLRDTDNRVFVARMEELSQTDQQYVRQESERRKAAAAAQSVARAGDISYGTARKLGSLANRQIDESSGLAASRRHPGVFWTHNDSGDDARLYAFDLKGKDRGSCVVSGIHAYDWEDIASFTMDGKSYLLVGDCGNNGMAAAVHMLYLVEEPPLDPAGGVAVREVPVVQTIHFAYEDDFRNCEAIAVDPTSRTILLATKEWLLHSHIYAMAWPKNDPKKATTARKIATLTAVPLVTAMDVSPDGRRAIVLTYANAYQYVREAGEDWAKAFSRPGRMVVMPTRIQGESICYGLDGRTLYLTSEKLPTPLWEVPVQDRK